MKNDHRVLRQLPGVFLAIILISVFFARCDKDDTVVPNDNVTVITATGNIAGRVDEFRAILGSQLNTTPGAVGGRRELNWDGIPANLLDKPLPNDFFNTIGNNVPATRQRGLVYSGDVNNFQVSNDGFRATNASTADAFTPFSGSQTFANVGVNLWDIGFQVPGEPIDATVQGFGLVFSDVDVANSTFIEFFNGTESIGKFFAPVHDANSNLSFLGVHFKTEKITHARVGHDGTLTEGGKDISSGGQRDFVVFDDFLFDEPVKK